MADFYDAMQQGFGWQVPEYFNMAEVCSRRWAAQPAAHQRVAIVEHQPADTRGHGVPPRNYSYAQLQQAADALSHVLTDLGVQRGDRVGLYMPNLPETFIAFFAVLKLGADGALASDGQTQRIVPGHTVPAVDATGAGDCFAGNLLARLSAGDSLWDATAYANAAACLSVQGYGAVAPLPYRDQVVQLLATLQKDPAA